jgi:hypothetical protein
VPDTAAGDLPFPRFEDVEKALRHAPRHDPDRVIARRQEADYWELQGGRERNERLIHQQREQEFLQKASDLRAEVDLCHHCGKPDEADGDHSCSCPHRDEVCADHPIPRPR